MRIVCSLLLLGMVTSCGCVRDPGDSAGISDYWDGCWAAAKRQDRK